MRLAHLHLPGITPFNTVSQIQQILSLRNLAYKKAISSASPSTSVSAPPDPTIITFTPNPVYTTGRRDLPPSNTSSPSDRQPSLELSLPPPLEPIRALLTSNDSNPPIAEYHPTLRGGQTTYHGPGQLVAYTILDLRRLGLSPRCHIRLLENSVIDLLSKYGVRGFVTSDPGVWVNDRHASTNTNANAKKITAVGVHLRRNVSSYGIGLNLTEEPMWFFRQIVACGLEGKEATSLEGQGSKPTSLREAADGFVQAFVDRLQSDFPPGPERRTEELEGVYEIGVGDVVGSSLQQGES
jgi:lipoyl(octanoyl) transferase 2